jgi:hypothetical protein
MINLFIFKTHNFFVIIIINQTTLFIEGIENKKVKILLFLTKRSQIMIKTYNIEYVNFYNELSLYNHRIIHENYVSKLKWWVKKPKKDNYYFAVASNN